jgi:Flp pilus assembly protein TadD
VQDEASRPSAVPPKAAAVLPHNIHLAVRDAGQPAISTTSGRCPVGSLRLVTFACALALAGCSTFPMPEQSDADGGAVWARQEQQTFADMMGKFALNPPAHPGSEAQAKAAEAVRLLKQMDLPGASKAVNAAVQLDDRNSYLHFLNAFIYHLEARQGDAQKNELAVEGYRLALRLDPGNWIAQEFLGLAYMDLKQFRQAKEQFTDVLLMSPDSTVSMYGLMVASYLTGDATTACAMADRFRTHSPKPDAAFARSSVSVYAACGDFAMAERMQGDLATLHVDPSDIERTGRRLAQWKSFYGDARAGADHTTSAAPGMMKASFDESPERLAAAFSLTNRDAGQTPAIVTPPASVPPPPNAPSPSPFGGAAPAAGRGNSPGMVLVDVVMVSTQETITTTKGVNLLDALTLQLGSASAPAFSRTYDSSSGKGIVITRTLTIPALAYSLNIANAASALNEVLARPTLAATEGQPSEFFAGTNLSAGVVSTSTLGSVSVVPVDKRFGVKLAITPTFLPEGMIRLKVDAQRTFLNADTANTGFAYRLDIAETTTNANVVMKMGETLVLSGLSERQTSSTRNGVPVLQDVPIVQYLFSNKKDIDFQRSVLILITPRSPAYTATAAQNAAGDASGNLKALQERMGFSTRTPPVVESVLKHLTTNDLYREFRQGDVAMERWDRTGTTFDRLRQALGFLYF